MEEDYKQVEKRAVGNVTRFRECSLEGIDSFVDVYGDAICRGGYFNTFLHDDNNKSE